MKTIALLFLTAVVAIGNTLPPTCENTLPPTFGLYISAIDA